MRKAIPVLLIVTLILRMNAVVFAAAPAERSIFRLQALGVIGDYEAEHTVTRGEAVSAFVRMLVDEPE